NRLFGPFEPDGPVDGEEAGGAAGAELLDDGADAAFAGVSVLASVSSCAVTAVAAAPELVGPVLSGASAAAAEEAGCAVERDSRGTGIVRDLRPLFLPRARSSKWTTRGRSAGSTIPCHSRVKTRVTPLPGPASLPTVPRLDSHSEIEERTSSRMLGRSAGSAANADSSRERISSAASERSGEPDAMRSATSSGVPVPKGGFPVAANARTAPQENTSEAGVGAS